LKKLGICVARSEIQDGVGYQTFNVVVLNVVEEASHKFDNFHNNVDGEFSTIVTMLHQIVDHQICRKTCELGHNIVQHIQKYIWQLGNLAANIVVSPDEIRLLDNLNCPDANAVKQRNRIYCPNIKQSSNHNTIICADFHNAIHSTILPKTFDGRLQRLFDGTQRNQNCVHF
jgi:hypothetical protein